MLEVAEHYQHFGGVSPINAQNRALIDALRQELDAHGSSLPIYWGNRNWHPMLTETIQQMADDGIQSALAFVTSAFSSYSGCRQYREDIARAQAVVGDKAPQIAKLRMFFNHPGFIEAVNDELESAIKSYDADRRAKAAYVFTAHSLPQVMADGCRYVEQLQESCRLVAERAGMKDWVLVYQSRSGPPSQPWLEPDVCDYLEQLAERDVQDVVIIPIGFVSDHMEVLFDLDTEAQQVCQRLGMQMVRVAAPGTHPKFVRMIRELIDERASGSPQRACLGLLGPSHDVCPEDCCPPGRPPKRGN
jgi:ferrochelatase